MTYPRRYMKLVGIHEGDGGSLDKPTQAPSRAKQAQPTPRQGQGKNGAGQASGAVIGLCRAGRGWGVPQGAAYVCIDTYI